MKEVKKFNSSVKEKFDNEWNDRYFRLNKSKRNWQIAFLTLCLLNFICLGIIFKMTNQITVVPYVVEVDKEMGIVRNIGDLRNVKYQVGDKNIISTLNSFVQKTRGIPLDMVRYGKDIQEQFSFLNDVSQQKLLSLISKDNVETKVKRQESRDINIISILKIRENTFQVRWEENNYTKEGTLYNSTKMSGIFTVGYLNPNTLSEQLILTNPLGIVIKDFNISKEQF